MSPENMKIICMFKFLLLMGAAILDCMTSLGNGLNYQQPNDVIKYNMAALMKAKNEGGSKILFANKKIHFQQVRNQQGYLFNVFYGLISDDYWQHERKHTSIKVKFLETCAQSKDHFFNDVR